MTIRQLCKRCRQVSAEASEVDAAAAPPPHSSTEDRGGVSTAIPKNLPEHRGRFGDGGMIGRPVVFADVQTLASQLFSFVELRLRIAKAGERNSESVLFRTVGSNRVSALLERGIQQLVGLVELAEILVYSSEGLVNFGLRSGIARQRIRLLYSTIDQSNHAQVISGPD